MKEIETRLNAKGMLLIGGIIITLTFFLGFMANKNGGEIQFDKNDIEQMSEAIDNYGKDVLVSKNRRGDLTITIKK